MDNERAEWLLREPREALSKKLGIAAWVITGLVFILVGMMRRPELHIPLPAGVSLAFLPAVHAALNALAALMLMGALTAVAMGRIVLHRTFIVAAMALSALFLVSYVAYHFTSAEAKYGDANFDGILDPLERASVAGSRPYYLALLASHIILAGISLPFILFTFIAGWTHRYPTHRRLAQWVFPIWLYVAISGPVCYWMMQPYYP